MLTAHAILRDRYSRRATTLDLATLGVSVILCLTTFVDPDALRLANVSPEEARVILGVSSAVVFFLALVQLRVDWKARAAGHQRACEKLARLKADYRRLATATVPPGSVDSSQVFEQADRVLEELAPIPDREFISLKARHRRKVEVSRFLDRYPGAPILLLRATLWWRHTRAALKGRPSDEERQD
jgi:hypothetical protein